MCLSQVRRQNVFTRVGTVTFLQGTVVTTRELFVMRFFVVFKVQVGLNAERGLLGLCD